MPPADAPSREGSALHARLVARDELLLMRAAAGARAAYGQKAGLWRVASLFSSDLVDFCSRAEAEVYHVRVDRE